MLYIYSIFSYFFYYFLIFYLLINYNIIPGFIPPFIIKSEAALKCYSIEFSLRK